MAKSVWVITEDFIFDPTLDEETAVGVWGPRGATEFDKSRCLSEGDDFELYDDDGEVYYRGKLLGDPFAPLDDFGTPNAGCTRIKVNGEEV